MNTRHKKTSTDDKQPSPAREKAPTGGKQRATGDKKSSTGSSTGDERASTGGDNALSAGVILVAYEKLFGGGRGVSRFARSGLRYVKLPDGAVLVEQNPKKRSEWAQLVERGHRVAWVLRDGEYLARVVDGEVVSLD